MRWTWGGWAAVALAACASRSQVTSPPPSDVASSVSIHQAKRSDERLTALDLNHDGRPDVWDYTVEAPGSGGNSRERRVRTELDMNGDGRPDLVKWYGAREQLVRETLDLNFDGRIDQVNVYEDGVLSLIERDTNADGKMDVWEEYADGHLVRVGKDLDFDGRVDQWTQPAGTPAASHP